LVTVKWPASLCHSNNYRLCWRLCDMAIVRQRTAWSLYW